MFKTLYILAMALLLTNPAAAQAKKKDSGKKADSIHIKTTPGRDAKTQPTKKVVQPMTDDDSWMEKPSNYISIQTEFGNMVIELYDSTPLHSNNFRKLVEQGFYDSLLFHRVIPNFMIQGGDPNSKNALAGSKLGDGGESMERIPAEFFKSYFHKKGALAAARDGNPEKKSSACQFYLVQGRTFTDEELDAVELKSGFKFSEEQRTIYKAIGGSPHLDQAYTVFGEVVEGLEVIGIIAALPRDANNRPLQDVRMQVKILKDYPSE